LGRCDFGRSVGKGKQAIFYFRPYYYFFYYYFLPFFILLFEFRREKKNFGVEFFDRVGPPPLKIPGSAPAKGDVGRERGRYGEEGRLVVK
jgi:hypothetical protein